MLPTPAPARGRILETSPISAFGIGIVDPLEPASKG